MINGPRPGERNETVVMYPGEIAVALTADELLAVVDLAATALRHRVLSDPMRAAMIGVAAKTRVALAAVPK